MEENNVVEKKQYVDEIADPHKPCECLLSEGFPFGLGFRERLAVPLSSHLISERLSIWRVNVIRS